MRIGVVLALTGALCGACTTAPRPRAVTGTRAVAQPAPARQGEEFRVVGAGPATEGDAYDAGLLFERAVTAIRAGDCDAALATLDRILREFPNTRWDHPAQYNRGVCHQRAARWPEAAEAYRAATGDPRDASLVRDAWFRLAVVGELGAQPQWVLDATAALEARPGLSFTDRVEVLTRRAAARLQQGDLGAADADAAQAIALAPTPEAVRALDDDTHAAQARVVAAEVTRARAAAVVWAADAPDAEARIAERAQLTGRAHAQYNEAIRAGNPHWAAAAGFRIGELYRDLYVAIVDATPPAEWDAGARAAYRRRAGERLRPLLQGALRSWEATLSMARRNGIADNAWVRRADEAVAQLRALILEAGEAPPAARSGTVPQGRETRP